MMRLQACFRDRIDVTLVTLFGQQTWPWSSQWHACLSQLLLEIDMSPCTIPIGGLMGESGNHKDVPDHSLHDAPVLLLDMQVVDLNSIHINPQQPWQFVVGGSDEFARIYDNRRTAGASHWGSGSQAGRQPGSTGLGRAALGEPVSSTPLLPPTPHPQQSPLKREGSGSDAPQSLRTHLRNKGTAEIKFLTCLHADLVFPLGPGKATADVQLL